MFLFLILFADIHRCNITFYILYDFKASPNQIFIDVRKINVFISLTIQA